MTKYEKESLLIKGIMMPAASVWLVVNALLGNMDNVAVYIVALALMGLKLFCLIAYKRSRGM